MLEQLRSVVVNNSKYLAVALVTASLVGGGATTVALVGNATPSPGVTAEEKKAEAAREAAEDKLEAAEGEGTRPTDTHGYCVSQAVKAAHATGKTGRDIAAAAHSCPKPHAAKKAAKASSRP
jgi:hypothetical protein